MSGFFGNRGKWRYRSLSRFSATKREFLALLVERGFEVKNVFAFDPLLPGMLTRVVPASLMFVVAVKVREASVGEDLCPITANGPST